MCTKRTNSKSSNFMSNKRIISSIYIFKNIESVTEETASNFDITARGSWGLGRGRGTSKKRGLGLREGGGGDIEKREYERRRKKHF